MIRRKRRSTGSPWTKFDGPHTVTNRSQFFFPVKFSFNATGYVPSRNCTEAEGLSDALPHSAQGPARWCSHRPKQAGGSAPLGRMVDVQIRANWRRPSLRVTRPQQPSADSTTIRSSTSLTGTSKPCQMGPARNCRPRRNGTFAARGGTDGGEFAWVMSKAWVASTWRTPGTAISPHQNLAPMASSALAPSLHSRQRANGCTLDWPMFGNGRLIGTRRSMKPMRERRAAFRQNPGGGPEAASSTVSAEHQDFH